MCGRYYVDDETAREIRRLVQKLEMKMDQEMNQKIAYSTASGREHSLTDRFQAVFPSQNAAVIKGNDRQLEAGLMTWGFPRFDGKGLLINARAETAMEKRSFRESVRHRRCVIPAKGFYEWNSAKEKFAFESPETPVLFLAGCFNWFESEPYYNADGTGGRSGIDEEKRFVILTTEALTEMRT